MLAGKTVAWLVGLAQSFLRIVLRRQLQNEKKIKDERKYLGISILFGGHFNIYKYISTNACRFTVSDQSWYDKLYLKYRLAMLLRLVESIPGLLKRFINSGSDRGKLNYKWEKITMRRNI
jgi:hypothetical protein